ncbi:DUF542 domain-containing protein [Zobellia uliginosa]|nr:DUF542 domain-containing protein [Zobellia uliginosa]
MMHILSKKPIGQIVAEDFRTIKIFKKHGINFYFLGNRTIPQVAEEHQLDAQLLLEEVEAIQNLESEENIDFVSWPLDLLVDYIEKKHHRYIKKNAPIVKAQLEELAETSGEKHPELIALSKQFNDSVMKFSSQMENEELFLFPSVRKMVKAEHSRVKLTKSQFGSLKNPVLKMKNAHKTESERFSHIVELTNNYALPEDGRDAYKTAFTALQEFVNDLLVHIHLENNILFPKIKTLEKELKHEL